MFDFLGVPVEPPPIRLVGGLGCLYAFFRFSRVICVQFLASLPCLDGIKAAAYRKKQRHRCHEGFDISRICAPSGPFSSPEPATTKLTTTGRLSRASRVERAPRELWLYRQAPDDRAWRTALSLASAVHRPSWQASRASAARLARPDNRSSSDAPVPQLAYGAVQARRRTAVSLTRPAL